jgi:hypothetical protein
VGRDHLAALLLATNVENKMSEPKFERRHYCAIAEVIRECRSSGNLTPREAAFGRMFKTKIGDMLAVDNPRFDRGRFEEACEP